MIAADAWAFGWEALVAIGTIGLALATFYLGLQARKEAGAVAADSVAVRDQVDAVRAQVELQRNQAQARLRAVVFPTTPLDWVWGRAQYEGKQGQSILLTNSGPGAALGVVGALYLRGDGVPVCVKFYAGNIATGDTIGARLSRPVSGLADAVGYVEYADLAEAGEATWVTDFRFKHGDGNQLYVESDPPRVLSETEKPDDGYPPRSWRAPERSD